MNKKNSIPEGVLQLRGRIGLEHPLHEALGGMVPKAAFKFLTELALEALSLRCASMRNLPGEHPLGETLRGMRANEALIYLIGVTSGGKHTATSDTLSMERSPQKTQEKARPLPLRVLGTTKPGAPETHNKKANSIDFDEEDLDAVLEISNV